SRARARSAYVALPRAGAEDPGTSAVGHGPPPAHPCQASTSTQAMNRCRSACETAARCTGPRAGRYRTGSSASQMQRTCAGPFPEFRQRKLADPRRGISDSRYLLDIACAGQSPGKPPTGAAIQLEGNVYMLTRLVK